ncbi:hypothetical protein HMPREF1980_02124 [Actinomyces sp. oral taxon 172 str. F0311]|nr:hypothetical protein HMPREF1980_02124 [Actinomyces sp. oral taxon 172 str. F0311]
MNGYRVLIVAEVAVWRESLQVSRRRRGAAAEPSQENRRVVASGAVRRVDGFPTMSHAIPM